MEIRHEEKNEERKRVRLSEVGKVEKGEKEQVEGKEGRRKEVRLRE